MSAQTTVKKLSAPSSLPKVLVILGTTSAGKTNLGVRLAAQFNGEIISADSRQVYKGMDIGTGKDLSEYTIGKRKIKYHLIDIVSPKQKFDLAKYQKLAWAAIADVLQRDKLPIIVGGTGLYVQALVDNYKLSSVKPDPKKRARLEKLSVSELFEKLKIIKPEFAARLNNSDKNNKRRLVRYLEIIENNSSEKSESEKSPYDFLLIGRDWPDQILKTRIIERLLFRLETEDLISEVKKLHQSGVSYERLISFGLEYKFVSQYLADKLDYDVMVEKLGTAIYRFAKRQKTWLRRWEKQGKKINWVEDYSAAEKLITAWLGPLKK